VKKFLIVLMAITLFTIFYAVIEAIIIQNRNDYLNYNQEVITEVGFSDLDYFQVSDYHNYLNQYPDVFPEIAPLIIRGTDYLSHTGEAEVLMNYQGHDDVLLMDEVGSVTWLFDVADEGFYHIVINYYPHPGKSSMIERILYINDEVPFSGAQTLTFHRIWGNQSEIIQDIHGNDIRPSQVEKPRWTQSKLSDAIGYVSEPYRFHLNAGMNTIALESRREPMVIESIEIRSVLELPSYDEVKAGYIEDERYKIANEMIILKQAEDPLYTTSPTIYPMNDRSSPKTMPSSPSHIRLNSIGGYNWRIAGDRITWSIEVEETGLYAISMRVKQKSANGMRVTRNIYIDGEIPFSELKNYAFAHGNDWRIQTLGTDEVPFLFYFEKNKVHTLTMEVSLGHYGPLIAQVQSSINELNRLYREILIYTGPEPDQFRDYQLQERIPNMVSRIRNERDNLVSVRQALIDIAGSKSEKTGILDTVIIQLDDFIKKPRDIHKQLSSYNGNISSLGTLVILLSAQPLEIDYFVIHHPDAVMPQSHAPLWTRLWFSFRAFIATFTTDYASVGKTTISDDDETIEVWLSIGRDQANVLRKLIDESFTAETNIQVDLKLVNAAVLLPATLAGVGPDVAMGQGNHVPVNYAMRNAAYDISQFDDFETISNRFKPSALVPYHYDDGYYALPEQQIFLMLFYRTDIFEELGLLPPETWDDVIAMIPDLQKLNLEFFLPVPFAQGAITDLPPNPIFSTLFFQNDGDFYINGLRESGFNEGKGPEIFETWVQFYTDYSFPVEANFVNRFRSGQMPVGISYYNTYNTLSVFAPEIRGRWNFLPVPGTRTTDAFGNPTIRRETVSTGTGIMILEQSQKKEASWEYLKWWTSTETQVRFGREMEGILGAAARYPTANVEALEQLPWTVMEYQKLNEQWDWVVGIPEVPGGYMTGRHLDNAFRLVLETNANPRETIYDYVQIINSEIEKKRREFGLD
jgi:ABC-type glycerol-3-phosphate transport system substrate-binding protein